jgi:gamma-glutamylaminecyclotransferase
VTLIFVYGTLKRGCANHWFLAEQTFVGEARTAPGFTLFELPGYPGMVARDGHPKGVAGEVWSVDDECLSQLDELEGTAEGLYGREAVPLLQPFAKQRIEAYVYLQTVEGRTDLGDTWTD